MAVETLKASGSEKFAPERKAAGWGLLGFLLGAGAGEVLSLGALRVGVLAGLATGAVTWYQARFGSRRSP